MPGTVKKTSKISKPKTVKPKVTKPKTSKTTKATKPKNTKNTKSTKTEVQSVIFDSSKFKGQQAVSWLREHNFKAPVKPDKTENYIRYRQHTPKRYKEFATMNVPGTKGVKFVLGVVEKN